MMKRLIFLPGFFLILIFSCKKDFVVVNIDKKAITVNAPANNTETTLNLITFWWDPLDGAEQYNLQIVKPNFSNTVQLLLDTTLTLNKFNFSLKPGSYQWRLKASNAGHSTAYQVYNLKIDTTSDLTEQLVNLLAPVNGTTTGNRVVTFNWSGITTAKKYEFQLNEGLLLDTLLTKPQLTYTLPAGANAVTSFSWNVKAINDLTQTQYNASPFVITVDLKGPSAPSIVTPGFGGTIAGTDSLKWKHSSDTSYDSVYVALDSLFISLPQQIGVSATAMPVAAFQLSASTIGTYYWWKVRSFDAFGNASAFSTRQKFRISP